MAQPSFFFFLKAVMLRAAAAADSTVEYYDDDKCHRIIWINTLLRLWSEKFSFSSGCLLLLVLRCQRGSLNQNPAMVCNTPKLFKHSKPCSKYAGIRGCFFFCKKKHKNLVIEHCSFWQSLFGWTRLTETLLANSFCPHSAVLRSFFAPVMCHSPHNPSTHIDSLLIAQLWREVLKNACFYRPLLEMLRHSPCPPPWRNTLFSFLFFFCLLFHCVLICQHSVT